MDTHRRSVIKAISWRIFATLIIGSIVWIFTGELALAAGIGVADILVKTGLYYLHERMWERVNFGRARSPELRSSRPGGLQK